MGLLALVSYLALILATPLLGGQGVTEKKVTIFRNPLIFHRFPLCLDRKALGIAESEAKNIDTGNLVLTRKDAPWRKLPATKTKPPI